MKILLLNPSVDFDRQFGTLKDFYTPIPSIGLAYVGAVLLIVLLGNPVVAFNEAEQRASQLAARAPVTQLSEQLAVKDRAAGTMTRLLAVAGSALDAVQSEIADWLRPVRAIVQTIATTVGKTIGWIAGIDLKQLFVGSRTAQPRGQPAHGTPQVPAGGTTEPGPRR